MYYNTDPTQVSYNAAGLDLLTQGIWHISLHVEVGHGGSGTFPASTYIDVDLGLDSTIPIYTRWYVDPLIMHTWYVEVNDSDVHTGIVGGHITITGSAGQINAAAISADLIVPGEFTRTDCSS
jgi:hypothetical protein